MTRFEIFADTSGWAHYFIRTEPFHYTANAFMHEFRRQGGRVVTSNYVLAELAALLHRPFRLSKALQIRYLRAIKRSPWVEVLHVDRERDQLAWELFIARQDKDWSLVDCSSFVLMQQRGLTHALTSDHHFTQAGFVPLLKRD